VEPDYENSARSDWGALETPFVGVAEAWSGEFNSEMSTATFVPFVAQYRLGEELIDGQVGAERALLTELFDTEFDEALEELLAEAESEAERLGAEETPSGEARSERHLERWIEPLRLESETLIDRIAGALEGRDLEVMTDSALGELLDSLVPDVHLATPAFENFFGSLGKKLKSTVKGAVSLAKKGVAAAAKLLPLGPILRRLKALVRPLLKRVINMALDKLPVAIRPYAARLAKKFAGELEEHESLGAATLAAPDIGALQLAFDAEVAALLLAPDDSELEELLTEVDAGAATQSDLLGELDDARARFLDHFVRLESGSDPTPLVEEFLPALLPVLRVGIRIGGRDRIKKFLARYIGRLIAPYVGAQITPALSKAIVDAGLGLMNLEAADAPPADPASEAFANVIEDTVGRVSELSEYELEDELTLEAAAYEGFQEGVAANFPAELLSAPSDVLETSETQGTWISMPRGRRKRYQKYSRVLPVSIDPQTASAIRTFGGRTLGAVLRGQNIGQGTITGRLHLYQAVPGSRVGRIMRAEARRGSIGRSGVLGNVHPLTPEAAGLLLGSPGLGREVEDSFLDRPDPLTVGERLYYLEVAGAGSLQGRPSECRLVLDLRVEEIRILLYLSESDAQGLAARLRRKEPLGASLATLRRIYSMPLRTTLASPRGRIRIIGEVPDEEAFHGGLLKIAQPPSQLIAKAIEGWTGRALGAELVSQRDIFVKATEAEVDGVTILLRLSDPPGLSAIVQLLRGGAVRGLGSLAELSRILEGSPRASVQVRPGYEHA
jgi:hypothetical protein